MLCKSSPVNPRIMKLTRDVYMPTQVTRAKDKLIDLKHTGYCLLKARGTGQADWLEKGHLTLVCNISKEPQQRM